jgi:hypothetical protein
MQEEWRAGHLASADAVRDRLFAEWEQSGPRKHVHEELYRRQALDVLEHTRLAYLDRAVTDTPNKDPFLEVELRNCIVRVGTDLLTHTGDGSVRVTREHRRRQKENDHTHERLALLRAAAEQGFAGNRIDIDLQYAYKTHEAKEVKANPRYEPGRLERYESAADGIIAGRFEADPAGGNQTCLGCAFHWICPA